MNCKSLQLLRGIVLILGILLVNQAVGDPNNGSFELYDYNETNSRNDPNGWHTENYVTVTQLFIPTPSEGSTSNWSINTAKGLAPFKGDSLLVLSSGDSSYNYSKAWQSVTINEGDKLTGVYFFGGCDYSPYTDWAMIKLVSQADPNVEIEIVYTDIDLLGDYGSFGGWQKFDYTFGSNEVGDYNLVLCVSDVGDYRLESYMAVDGLILCRNQQNNPPPGKADFNCDCTVNFEDFTILANDWMYDCNNPIMYYDGSGRQQYYDPNCNCLLGTDIDGDGPVDINDLQIMSGNWLGAVDLYNPPVTGDLNDDGIVDFEDFTIFAVDWMSNCDDPLIYGGPNNNCLLGTDLNNDGPVDIGDLKILSENWLVVPEE